MTTIEQQILPLITGPERSVSRQEIEARLEALEKARKVKDCACKRR